MIKSAPPCEAVRLPTKGPGAHKGAAAFLAVLSYPWEETEENTLRLRVNFLNTAMAWFVRYQVPKDAVHAAAIKKQAKAAGSPLLKMLLKIPTRSIDQGPLSLASKRIQKKMTAGKAMGTWMMLGQTRNLKAQGEQRNALDQWLRQRPAPRLADNGPAFTIEGKEATINEAAKFAVKLGMENNVRNAKERIWDECKPVLHLIMALGAHLDGMPHGKKVDIGDLIANPAWLEPVLIEAERLRTIYFPHMPGMCINTEDTIQVLPTE